MSIPSRLDLNPLGHFAPPEPYYPACAVHWLNDRQALNGDYYVLYGETNDGGKDYHATVFQIPQTTLAHDATLKNMIESAIEQTAAGGNEAATSLRRRFLYEHISIHDFAKDELYLPGEVAFLFEEAPIAASPSIRITHHAPLTYVTPMEMRFSMKGDLQSADLYDEKIQKIKTLEFHENGILKTVRRHDLLTNSEPAYEELEFKENGTLMSAKLTKTTMSHGWARQLHEKIMHQESQEYGAARRLWEKHKVTFDAAAFGAKFIFND